MMTTDMSLTRRGLVFDEPKLLISGSRSEPNLFGEHGQCK